MLSDVYFPRINGVSTSIKTLREELLALGHECLLVAPRYGEEPEEPGIHRLAASPVPRDPEDFRLHWHEVRRFAASLEPEQVDVIHVQTPFIAHYAGQRIARRLGVPVVESYHTYFEHYLPHYVSGLPAVLTRSIARGVTRVQCRQVQAVISPSSQMADMLRRYGVKTPIEVLPTGLSSDCFVQGDGARFRQSQGIGADRPLVLFVGRLAHEKNIDFLLRMLGALCMQRPDVLFVLAGAGPAEASLRQQVRALGLQDHVHFAGYLDRHGTADRQGTLLDAYAAAEVFVFASRTETQGLVLLEAMAQGTPIVSTAVMGTIDVLADARGALVVPEDVSIFASRVADLLDDRVRRAELSALARADAQRWSSRKGAERLLRLYERVIEGEPIMTNARFA